MMARTWLWTLALLALLALGSLSVFTVSEHQDAILFRTGKAVRTNFGPGLYFKIPFVNTVQKFDGRILTLDMKPAHFLTAEKKDVLVDAFIKWRIADVAEYYTALGGDEAQADLHLSQIVKSFLRRAIGAQRLQQVVTEQSSPLTDGMIADVNARAKALGIRVVGVGIKRVGLPADISGEIYKRMIAQQQRLAQRYQTEGAQEAQRLRTNADDQKTVILAEAFRAAEQIRGQGDAQAAQIYARAYGQDPAFYALYRSLKAYKSTFASKHDVVVLEPDSEFFKYFNGVEGKR
ncbi:MAG: protease modulator HflC [Gammaproteobacteria bacterium]|nr:protease modulator HflC [Gammaproteobacteria bacterium]